MKTRRLVLLALVIVIAPLSAVQEPAGDMDQQLAETGALCVSNHRTEMISIDKVVNGTEFSAGEEFLGILAHETSISFASRMTLTSGLIRFEFHFTPNVLQQLQQN